MVDSHWLDIRLEITEYKINVTRITSGSSFFCIIDSQWYLRLNIFVITVQIGDFGVLSQWLNQFPTGPVITDQKKITPTTNNGESMAAWWVQSFITPIPKKPNGIRQLFHCAFVYRWFLLLNVSASGIRTIDFRTWRKLIQPLTHPSNKTSVLRWIRAAINRCEFLTADKQTPTTHRE